MSYAIVKTTDDWFYVDGTYESNPQEIVDRINAIIGEETDFVVINWEELV